jgi:predicted NUDIX family NTP pyrophosphohydrolase
VSADAISITVMPARKQSAGLLMFSHSDGALEVLIAHPGGPLFAEKHDGHWGIPKGEFLPNEPALEAAKREFLEETGLEPETGTFIDLGFVIQRGGKKVFAWGFEGRWPKGLIHKSNFCQLEWPRNSGKWITIPEIDAVEMVSVERAKILMRAEQFAFVERLIEYLNPEQKLDLATAKK